MMRLAWKRGTETLREGARVHVSATRFTYRSLRSMPGVMWHGANLRGGWSSVPGAIGVFVALDLPARTTYTVSLWTSEADLRRWVSSPDHTRLMRDYRSRMESSAVVSWDEDRAVPKDLFRQGLLRLAAKDNRAESREAR